MTGSLQQSVAAAPGRPAGVPAKKSTRARRLQSFYESALDEAERGELSAARSVKGLDEEIALLRLRLKQAVAKGPADLALMLRGVEILARLVASRYRLPAASAEELAAAMRAALHAAGLPADQAGVSR
jgi:hypothetical protein